MVEKTTLFMKPRFTLIILALCSLLPNHSHAAVPVSKSAPELQPKLEAAYSAWRHAMNNKDFNAWKSATAAYRQMETRNRIISQHQSYPDALFSISLLAPDLSKLTLLDIFSKGDTANAVYFGKADFGLAENQAISDNFLVLKYIREAKQWKFDNLRIIKFGNDPELLLKLRNADFSFLQEAAFQPTGLAPLIAKSVKTPAYLAELWIAANGFDVTVNINNGNHKSRLKNDDGRDLIIGGLAKGENTISLLINPVATESNLPKRLEIAIYAAQDTGKPAKRVFHYAPDPSKVPPSHAVSITVR